MNLEKMPITALNLPAPASEKLISFGIRTAYDLLLFAYLEEQREPLAQYLDLPRYDLDAVLDRLLQDAPVADLEQLAALARKIGSIPSGLLPPDGDRQGEKCPTSV